MKMILPRTVTGLANNRYFRITAVAEGTTAFPGFTQCVWPVAGAFSNFVVWVETPPGAGSAWTFTLIVNSVATLLTVTIADLETTGRITGVSVPVGEAADFIQILVTATGTPTGAGTVLAHWTLEFDSTQPYESGYSGTIGTAQTGYGSVWEPWNLDATPASVRGYAACSGYLTMLCAATTFAGLGASGFQFYVYKNGVRQDGTAGTVNTGLLLNHVAERQVARTDFLLRVDRGDYFYISVNPSGTPNPNWTTYALKFVADVDGQSQFCASNKGFGLMTNLVPSYIVPNASSNGYTWLTVQQFLTRARCGVTPLCLADLYLVCQDDPLAGTRTFDLLRDDLVVANAPTGVVSPGSLIIDDDRGISYTDGQVIGSFQHTPDPSSVPVVSGEVWWTLTQYLCSSPPPPPPPPGTRTGCPDSLPLTPATGQGCSGNISPQVV